VHFAESLKRPRAEFVRVVARAVHGDHTAETIGLFIDRVVKMVTKTKGAK
jgi:hypothetical protein